METTSELDLANNVDNNTLTELIEDIKELTKTFENLEIDTTTYKTKIREIDPSVMDVMNQ